jgi:uncharacterized phage-associated protein
MLLTIADIVLRIAKENGRQLTPMQLMKLTYIANGWSLAMRDKPLFKEPTEAWKYGPVMPDLYHATKSFGRSAIPLDKINDNSDGMLEKMPGETGIIRLVYDRYKNKDGIALSSLTHKSGTPWYQTYDEGRMRKRIPEQLIKDYYKETFNFEEQS